MHVSDSSIFNLKGQIYYRFNRNFDSRNSVAKRKFRHFKSSESAVVGSGQNVKRIHMDYKSFSSVCILLTFDVHRGSAQKECFTSKG